MIVLCGGVFDVFHYGHLMHLEEAKSMGELLYVAVTRDAHVNKGPGRPVFPEQERLAVIKALSIVHYAFLVDSAMEAIKKIEPDIYVKGAEYIGLLPEEEYCITHGISVAYTCGKVYSSTKLLHFYT
jgi:cytidyltransferase-like protein